VVTYVQSLALKAHNALGCRDLSRVDVIVDKNHKPWLLEINTLPGFTPKSLLPEMAGHAGIAFGPLVDLLVKRAFNRRKSAA
jgi:D-alanine-D-alanine ligase